MEETLCIYCKSKNIVRNGFRKTRQRGTIQIYKCQKCGHTFCIDDGFRWKHYAKEKIVETLEFYIGGGNTLRFLAENFKLSKNTIMRWVFEYVGRILRFANKLVPKIIQKINMDELFLKMCNQFFYLWDAICADSRFAFFFFSPMRKNRNAEELIKQFKNALFMVFDGAFQYPSVLKKMFGIWWYYHHTHRCKDFEDKKNNNLIERLNNTIRSLTHKRRGYKSLETERSELRFLELYYNFVREHMTIKMTPAEKTGLIEYFRCKNEVSRWKFLIKQATHSTYFYLMSAINHIFIQCQPP